MHHRISSTYNLPNKESQKDLKMYEIGQELCDSYKNISFLMKSLQLSFWYGLCFLLSTQEFSEKKKLNKIYCGVTTISSLHLNEYYLKVNKETKTFGHINKDFFYKKMYGHFARHSKKWLNNKVNVLPRWP